MNRYALFAYESYYPAGGWQDFVRTFDTIERALGVLEERAVPVRLWARNDREIPLENRLVYGNWDFHNKPCECWHIVDLLEAKVVRHNSHDEPFAFLNADAIRARLKPEVSA